MLRELPFGSQARDRSRALLILSLLRSPARLDPYAEVNRLLRRVFVSPVNASLRCTRAEPARLKYVHDVPRVHRSVGKTKSQAQHARHVSRAEYINRTEIYSVFTCHGIRARETTEGEHVRRIASLDYNG